MARAGRAADPSAVLTSLLQPTSLSNWLQGAGAALSTSDLAQLLATAGQRIPGLGHLVAGRDTLAAGWDALITRCAGGDGLLPGGAPDIAGTTASTPGRGRARRPAGPP